MSSKSIPELLAAIEKERSVSYGKTLAFVHRWDAFTSEAQKILTLLRRQQDTVKSVEAATGRPTRSIANGPAGSVPLSGELLDELVVLYEPRGEVGGYALRKGLPALTLRVEKKRGGVHIVVEPSLYTLQGLDYSYLYNEDTIWKLERAEAARLLPALNALCGSGLFFTSKDAVSFCSFVLPELGRKITIDDPDRLLLNQIPLEPVVQFYLDAPHMGAVRAHPEFLYGEDRVTPFVAPTDLLRDARAERRAGRLLQTYLTQQTDTSPAEYGTDDEDALVTFLEEGVPALLAEGEVYLSDAFRDLQAAPPKISVGVSVQGSVLDLEVDTGEFPVSELKALLKSLHQKKRYHRLRDGRLLRLDDSLEVLDELNETLELSGAKLGQNHAQLPLYRAPSFDWALSGQTGVRFNRDDAFRRISRSFHAVKDSEYAPPVSLQKTLRKYQRDGYRWLRTLDGYGMGGILADDMGLGKTVQVLSYLLAMKQNGQTLPSLIVCPASLVYNWVAEVAKHTPELRVEAIAGTKPERRAMLDGVRAAQQDTGVSPTRESARPSSAAAASDDVPDVLVTSYDLLRRDIDDYAGLEFYCMTLDEAQYIKNAATKVSKAVRSVTAVHRFALTGTPIENRLSELWSIFDFLMPGMLGSYAHFRERFEMPVLSGDETAQKKLQSFVGPFILRRLKSQVLKDLPDKIENVITVQLQGEQRKLYAALEQQLRSVILRQRPADFNTGKIQILAQLTRLRQVCCDPRLIYENADGHASALSAGVQSAAKDPQQSVKQPVKQSKARKTVSSAKLDAIIELVDSCRDAGRKMLIFSQFTSYLDLIAQRLRADGVEYDMITGATPKKRRLELVDRFNADATPVFLISLKAGNTGLNLTGACVVVHADPWWNAAAQDQATDRAHRIGQTQDVNVYQIVAKDTIEERILNLQRSKTDLAQRFVDSASSATGRSMAALTKDDLLALLG